MKRQLSYLWAMMVANMKSYRADMKKMIVMSFFMIVQNLMFFVLWIILFGKVKDLNGWGFVDYARMMGMMGSAIGLSLFLLNGSRGIAYRIQDGSLDSFIARPRAVLPALLMSSSSAASFGDVLYGPLMWGLFGKMDLAEWGLMIVLTLNASLLFTALTIIIFSLSFWLKGNIRFSEQLFEMLIISSCNILKGQPFLVRFVAFTVLPVAFMNLLPVNIIRTFDPLTFAIIIGATVFYGLIAVVTFTAGLRRYREANV